MPSQAGPPEPCRGEFTLEEIWIWIWIWGRLPLDQVQLPFTATDLSHRFQHRRCQGHLKTDHQAALVCLTGSVLPLRAGLRPMVLQGWS